MVTSNARFIFSRISLVLLVGSIQERSHFRPYPYREPFVLHTKTEALPIFQQLNNHLLPSLGLRLVVSLPIEDKQTAFVCSTTVPTRFPQPLPPLG